MAEAPKRKRGRPRKHPLPPAEAPKRGPGRPRKTAAPVIPQAAKDRAEKLAGKSAPMPPSDAAKGGIDAARRLAAELDKGTEELARLLRAILRQSMDRSSAAARGSRVPDDLSTKALRRLTRRLERLREMPDRTLREIERMERLARKTFRKLAKG